METKIKLPQWTIKSRTDEQMRPIPRRRTLTGRPKIALVIPNLRWVDNDMGALWDLFPWNLCLLASMVRELADVVIIDLYKDNLSKEQF